MTHFNVRAALLCAVLLAGPVRAEELGLLGVAAAAAAPAAAPAAGEAVEKPVPGAVVLHGHCDLPPDVTLHAFGMYRRDVGLLGTINADTWVRVTRTASTYRVQFARTRYQTFHDVPLLTAKLFIDRPGHRASGGLFVTTDASGGYINPEPDFGRVRSVRVKMGTVVASTGPEIRIDPVRDTGETLSGMTFLMPASGDPVYRVDLEAALLGRRAPHGD